MTPGPTPEKNNDNWIHRSSGMLCRTCMYYVPKINLSFNNSGMGRCRRHAPTMSGFPAMFGTDWCGDHKLDEEKLKNEPTGSITENQAAGSRAANG